PAAPPAKVAASIARLFGPGARVDTLRADTASVLRVSRADSLLGFAAVGNVLGKDQPITFLVAIDPTDRLKDVDILVYREPYGGEVAYEPWRRQFRGKSTGDSLRVGKEIRSISGATISVHAVTLGVRRMLAELLTIPHTHLLSMAVSFVLTGLGVALCERVSERWKRWLIAEPFVALLVSFSAMWLMRYVDPRFSWLLEASSALLAVTFYVQSYVILRELRQVEREETRV